METSTILVTGATGFIGGALVDELLARGHTVRALGRNLTKGQALQARGADFRPVDLRDRPSMIQACQGVDVVFHVGALASPWGPTEDFEEINVGGTRNTIAGCRAHDVQRLVYVSSPSVLSRFEDQFNLTEDRRPGPDFVSTYSRTKWEGEVLVNDASSSSLETVIVRPKAVYGPGDTTIFPRLIEAASRGRLPIIGDGSTTTNITFIDDVVQGLLLAMESDAAPGNTYVLTGDEDVLIWEVVGEVLERVGHRMRDAKLAAPIAMKLGAITEKAWGFLKRTSEPPLTRYTVGIFAYSQTYDISAAREDLGYTPAVAVQEGIDRFVEDYLNQQDPSELSSHMSDAPISTPTAVDYTLLTAGVCHAPEMVFFADGGTGPLEIPAHFGVIEHPDRGTILFDTGYSYRFFEATRPFPARIFRWITPAVIDKSTGAAAQLAERGIDPLSIDTILLSHFDPDHYGGLRDFPNARVICTAEAWESVRGKEGVEALIQRVLPGHLPIDLSARLSILPDFDGPPIGPFERSHDILGDGSLRAVMLPGHAPGQYGVFVHRDHGPTVFLAADGCWTCRTLEDDHLRARAHRLIADDRNAQAETYRLLRRLRLEMPDLIIVPSHCPDAAQRLSNEPNPTIPGQAV